MQNYSDFPEAFFLNLSFLIYKKQKKKKTG